MFKVTVKTLNSSANVTTRFNHLKIGITVPSQLVYIIKIPIS